MQPLPTQSSLDSPERLRIAWSDGQSRIYSTRELRDHCPCASCIEKRRGAVEENPLQVLRPEETQPLRIAAMQPAGRYAYAIHFSDGHDTGIYTLDLLRELGEVVDP